MVLSELSRSLNHLTHRQARFYFIKQGSQPLWNCKLLLVYRLIRRATSLIHNSKIKTLLSLPSVILVLIFFNVKTLIISMSLSKHARGWLPWSLRRPGARGHHVGDPCYQAFKTSLVFASMLRIINYVLSKLTPMSDRRTKKTPPALHTSKMILR